MLRPERLRQFLISLLIPCLLVSCDRHEPAKSTPVVSQSSPVRGVWITTAYGLDWPSQNIATDLDDEARIRLQKQDLINKLDNLVSLGINTLYFQAKPDGTALYRSVFLPWSAVLTGTMGKDPGYDPLAFVIEQAHLRGLKVHAWLNPYRITMDTSTKTVAALNSSGNASPASVYVLNPGWVRIAANRFVLDPGLPEVRQWVVNVVSELVSHYAIDGVQFDDYFYNETPDSRLNDDISWKRYGGAFINRSDWRRDNTLQMIREVSGAIHTLRPGVVFGVSPSGIWRNAQDDEHGSQTLGGNPAYDTVYADTRQWVQQGLLDYIAPQLYWSFSRDAASYDVLAHWWANTVRGTRTQLYIGVALYKVNQTTSAPDWRTGDGITELKRQLDLNDSLSGISGTILFRENFLHQPSAKNAVAYLRERWARKR